MASENERRESSEPALVGEQNTDASPAEVAAIETAAQKEPAPASVVALEDSSEPAPAAELAAKNPDEAPGEGSKGPPTAASPEPVVVPVSDESPALAAAPSGEGERVAEATTPPAAKVVSSESASAAPPSEPVVDASALNAGDGKVQAAVSDDVFAAVTREAPALGQDAFTPDLEASHDDRTVISSPPVPDNSQPIPLWRPEPFPPEAAQSGSEFEILESHALDSGTAPAIAASAAASAVPPRATLAAWAERSQPKRRNTMEVVRKLAGQRVSVTSLQLGVIVVAAGLLGGVVSRATAGSRASAPVAKAAVVERVEAAKDAPAPPSPVRPSVEPVAEPTPAPHPVEDTAKKKRSKPAKAKKTLAAADAPKGTQATSAKH